MARDRKHHEAEPSRQLALPCIEDEYIAIAYRQSDLRRLGISFQTALDIPSIAICLRARARALKTRQTKGEHDDG